MSVPMVAAAVLTLLSGLCLAFVAIAACGSWIVRRIIRNRREENLAEIKKQDSETR